MVSQGQKRKILITTDLYATNTNGVVTSIQNLFDELTAKGHDVRILTISGDIHFHKEGAVYYVRSLPLGMVYPDVRMPASLPNNKWIQELIDWKPDVIHSQCEFFSFQFATRISRATGAPIIHTYHTLYEQYVTYLVPSKRLGHYLVRLLSRERLRKVKTVVAPTAKVEHALQSYGVHNPIQIVPSGISLEQHYRRLSPEERARKRRQLGIREDQQVMLNLGRLGTEKNLGELMAFFAEALRSNEALVFLIVGDGPAKEDLERQARELGVADHVIFTGMVDPSQVQNYYQLADVFVSASTSETQGLTYIEAAANGLPLLCRQDDCLEDVLKDGENGYEYASAQEFLQAMHQVMGDPKWREAASKRSEEIAAGFEKKAFGSAMESVYESVL